MTIQATEVEAEEEDTEAEAEDTEAEDTEAVVATEAKTNPELRLINKCLSCSCTQDPLYFPNLIHLIHSYSPF